MSGLELLFLSIALGTDLFSVAIPIGMNRIRLRDIFRAAVVFAIFHIVLILTGYYGGHWLGAFVEHLGSQHLEYPILAVQNWASILGALVLIGLGLCMIKENLASELKTNRKSHPLQGMSLIILAFSVSVDALAAGFGMGMMDVNLVKLSIVLGIVIFIIAILGLGLGRHIGRYVGKWAEIIGGLVLIFLGIHVIWSML